MKTPLRPNSRDYIISRPGFENAFKHTVRNPIESKVCEWLMRRNIAHRHASEPFVLKVPRSGYETYVPDIILHDKREKKRVVIETLHQDYPRKGRTLILASFRKSWKESYFLILVTNSYSGFDIAKGAFDILVDVTALDVLEKEVPPPPGEYLKDFLSSTPR